MSNRAGLLSWPGNAVVCELDSACPQGGFQRQHIVADWNAPSLLKVSHFSFFEADPRPECPLKGKRILIALDAIAAYVQGSGRAEIRVEPANDKLVEVYQTVYEFEVVSPRKGKPYCRKRI